MVYIQNKNPNLDKFWRVLQLKMLVFFGNLVYFTAVWYFYGIFRGNLVCFSPSWCFVSRKIWQPCPLRLFFIPRFLIFPNGFQFVLLRKSNVCGVHSSDAGLPDGIFSNQKKPIRVNFGGSCNRKCYNILWPFGIDYVILVYFMAILVI
jgi:hypothetical protein